jgi:hypothetical protein
MTKSSKQFCWQMNLPLHDAVTPAVPGDKQKELTQTLTELLINVAQEHFPAQDKGDESE